MNHRKLSASALILAGYSFVATPISSNATDLGEVERAPYPSALPYYEPMTGHERRAQIENVQEALEQKGYDPGPIDGTMEAQTRQAIRSFQQANNLEVTGVVDAETARLLEVKEATGTESAVELWEEQRLRD
jgi:peptidoglycan hydrolase-like protein with peptidoglycan-binding domain